MPSGDLPTTSRSPSKGVPTTKRVHLRRALVFVVLLYVAVWAPTIFKIQVAPALPALPSFLQGLDDPCAECFSIDLDTPCPVKGTKDMWCQRFSWARRDLPASPEFGFPAIPSALVFELNCRHQYRYDYYHMLLDCSVPLMPMLGLAQRLSREQPPSALVGIHRKGIQNITDHVLQASLPYPFMRLEGRLVDGVQYAEDTKFTVDSMNHVYLHRNRSMFEKCSPCYRHTTYKAYGIETDHAAAAAAAANKGTVLVLWRESARHGINAGGRAIMDHDHLVAELRQRVGRDRVVVFYGNETTEGTVRAFSEARAVVGYHGAGLVNCLFCRPGTMVVEITTFREQASSHEMQVWRANTPHIFHGLGLDFSLHVVEHHHLRPGVPENVTDWDHTLKPNNVYLSREHIYLVGEKVERALGTYVLRDTKDRHSAPER